MQVSSPPPAFGVRAPAPAPRPGRQEELIAPDLAPELRSFAQELEEWAAANAADARRDTMRFWAFKGPAMVSSAVSGVLSTQHLADVAALLAAVATLCVLVDAVNPGGQLRNAHMRAVHELRDLEHYVVNEWRIGRLKGKEAGPLAAQILESASKIRERIAKELKAAETSFGTKKR